MANTANTTITKINLVYNKPEDYDNAMELVRTENVASNKGNTDIFIALLQYLLKNIIQCYTTYDDTGIINVNTNAYRHDTYQFTGFEDVNTKKYLFDLRHLK